MLALGCLEVAFGWTMDADSTSNKDDSVSKGRVLRSNKDDIEEDDSLDSSDDDMTASSPVVE